MPVLDTGIHEVRVLGMPQGFVDPRVKPGDDEVAGE